MRKQFTRTDLEPSVASDLAVVLAEKDGYKPFLAILQVIAETLDDAINGDNSYVTIGITKDRKALMMTVNFASSKMYLAGDTLYEIAQKAAELLDS
jgi:hypothetical protein